MEEAKVNEVKTGAPETKVNETNTEVELIKEKIKLASAEINLILVKHKLEFVVVHKFVVNPELKQEEIAHDIILRPVKNEKF